MHFNLNVRMPAIEAKIDWLVRQGERIMAKIEQFQAALAAVDAETTRIADYLNSISAQLKRDDLTEAQEADVLAGLEAAAARLKGVGADVEAPIPSGDLPPVEDVPAPAEEVPPTGSVE
jgi:hypothetical protein